MSLTTPPAWIDGVEPSRIAGDDDWLILVGETASTIGSTTTDIKTTSPKLGASAERLNKRRRWRAPRPKPSRPLIAVMGRTGSGKSTFISHLSKQDYTHAIGHKLKSSTQTVFEAECEIDGHEFVLVDTPGFDDTHMEDGAVLKLIANWLKESHENGKHLSGLIYMHDINEARAGKSSLTNMSLFRKLTGKESMENVILLTTKWDALGHGGYKMGCDREKELSESTGFWKEMLVDRATTKRHDGTKQGARETVLNFLPKQPTMIRLQKEMADGRALLETDAGKHVLGQLADMEAKHTQELTALRAEMESAAQSNKIELTNALKEQYQKSLDEAQERRDREMELMSEMHETLRKRLDAKQLELDNTTDAIKEHTEASMKAEDDVAFLMQERDRLRREKADAQANVSKLKKAEARAATALREMDHLSEESERLRRDREELQEKLRQMQEVTDRMSRDPLGDYMESIKRIVEQESDKLELPADQEKIRRKRETAMIREEAKRAFQQAIEEAAKAIQVWKCGTPGCGAYWRDTAKNMEGRSYQCGRCFEWTDF